MDRAASVKLTGNITGCLGSGDRVRTRYVGRSLPLVDPFGTSILFVTMGKAGMRHEEATRPFSYYEILERSKVRFGYRIAVLGNWYRLPGYKFIEKEFGITEPECSALFCIGHSDHLTATDVCKITGRPKNSMSRAISALLKKKLLIRTADNLDARKKRLLLTPEGRELFDKFVPIFQGTEGDVIEPLTPSELSDLDRLLSKMVKNVADKAKVY